MDQVDCPLCQGKLCQGKLCQGKLCQGKLCQGKLAPEWDSVRDADSSESFSIYRCEDCGLGVTQPIPEDLGRYYAKHYHGGRHGITASLCDYRRRRFIRPFRGSSPNPRLLDIGCGDGTFLKDAQKDGWQVWGMEEYPTLAHMNSLKIYDSLTEANLSSPYECITLWHVLEHLSDLNASIATIRSLLKPDGTIVIAVPNSASFQAKVFGKSWLHLDVPRHLYHFTEPSLRRLLNQHGLGIEYISHSEFEYDLLGWVQSTFNRLGAEPNSIFKMLTGRRTGLSFLSRCMHLIGAAVLFSIGVLPVLVGGWFGLGGVMVIAVRPLSISKDAHSHV